MVHQIQISKSARQTFELGEKLANTLKKGSASWRIIACYGELGSGKTTFVQGLAAGLGIKKRIVSPTFIFIRQYSNFYHIDLYRIEKPEDARGLGLEEIFAEKNAIIAIEWAEKIKNLLPKKRIDIKFEILNENERKITTSY